ncbi:glycosyltransferase family 4 protein [Candidatus Parcubacteria bacterium]|nr:glycosyltransferase family 4 protein [Candidatus Parcubacteria bacterium]
MKMLYIANARIPTEKAHGIQIMKTAEAFAAAGVGVELVLPRRHNRFKGLDPFAYYGLNRRFPIRFLPSLDVTRLRLFGHPAFVLQQISFSFIVAVWLLGQRADVYYFRDLLAASWFSRLCRRGAVGVEIHSVSPRRARFYRALSFRVGRLVAISHGVQDALLVCGVAAEKITVAPDGVDLASFERTLNRAEARTMLNLPAHAHLVVYAGNLFPWKGVDTLIEATPDLPEGTEVIFVGGSPDQLARARRFVQSRAIDHVQFVGHQLPTDVPQYLAAADVLVLPTSAREPIGARFTSPLKLFEYMAVGRPIVASDVPSSREVLTGETAIFVRADSPSSLAEGIGRALRDPEFSAKISKKAHEVVKSYSWANRVRFILASFDNEATR